MANQKRAGFKMKQSPTKSYRDPVTGVITDKGIGGQNMKPLSTGLYAPGTLGGGGRPSPYSEYKKKMQAYKHNEWLGQQKGKARKGYRKMEMPVKPSRGGGANLTPEQIREMSINARPNPYASGGGGMPGTQYIGGAGFGPYAHRSAVTKKSGFTMKKGSKPNKSEFFKGKK